MWRSVPFWDAGFSGRRCCGNLDEVAAVGAHLGAMFAMGVIGKASSRASALLRDACWPASRVQTAATWWSAFPHGRHARKSRVLRSCAAGFLIACVVAVVPACFGRSALERDGVLLGKLHRARARSYKCLLWPRFRACKHLQCRSATRDDLGESRCRSRPARYRYVQRRDGTQQKRPDR